MYNTPQNGKAAAGTAVAPTTAQAQRLADLRFMVLDTVSYSPHATAEEKARTAASVARCQSEAVLLKWYANVLTVLSERELAPPVAYATAAQKEEIIRLCNHPAVSRGQKSNVLLGINRLTDAQATALLAELRALTTEPTPPRPRRKARANTAPALPALQPADSLSPGLLTNRGRSHNGTLVCPTYSALPRLEMACLDKLTGDALRRRKLVECTTYAGALTHPCKASARLLTVFVN